jgi:hypothetical protein
LQIHAGHTVLLTGSMDDETITVTKIVMPAKKISKAIPSTLLA